MQRIEKIRRRIKEAKEDRRPAQGSRLRQCGVYALPNGKEFVVGVGREGHYFLYHPLIWKGRAWIVNMPVAYEISPEGAIVTGTGQPTCWSIEDLTDTSQTIEKEN
ncbi:MAG TPA: hypothetical protein VD966_07135 [Pyrinomonadaceae bacterium]|nr:hypothetical protein [Pyrinomonadaceae bacterium]